MSEERKNERTREKNNKEFGSIDISEESILSGKQNKLRLCKHKKIINIKIKPKKVKN